MGGGCAIIAADVAAAEAASALRVGVGPDARLRTLICALHLSDDDAVVLSRVIPDGSAVDDAEALTAPSVAGSALLVALLTATGFFRRSTRAEVISDLHRRHGRPVDTTLLISCYVSERRRAVVLEAAEGTVFESTPKA
jgi:hypothetical protein